MIRSQATCPPGQLLNADTILQTLHSGLDGEYTNKRVLILTPDATRTLPFPQLFRNLVTVLHDTKQLDFMVALGTHPAMTQEQLNKLVGITQEERDTTFKHIGLLNHAWDSAETLTQIGTLPKSQIQEIAGSLWHHTLGDDVPININRHIFEYDHVMILGPTFPHEVAGFSGGGKYLFPGISGPEMINVSHWLGALTGVRGTIGLKNTPVRTMIHAAAEHVTVPITLISLVVVGKGLTGMFVGDLHDAWHAAADLSSERHIIWYDEPVKQVLSWAPPMYDELWTGGKAMYKLDPVVADGGEVIIYAPHLDEVSVVHGRYIFEIGYHCRGYILDQWEKFKHIPLGVLAHSIHVNGDGSYENGVEHHRVKVTLASKVSEADCKRLNLGYLNPNEIEPSEWANREDEGILFVPKAGEMLYRVRGG